MDLKARDKKYLNTAIQIAKANPIIGLPQLAAIIVEKKSIVGVGLNSFKTSPMQHWFCHHPKAIHEHAEINAIRNAIKTKCNMKFTNSSIYIARVLKDGTPALAKPCQGCANALDQFNFKKIIWTQ